MNRTNKYIVAGCAVLLALSGIFIAQILNDASRFSESSAANQLKISELTDRVTALENSQVPKPSQIRQTLHSAAAQGQAVAELQQKYMSASEEEIAQISSQISDYFIADDGHDAAFIWLAADEDKPEWSFASNYTFSQDSLPVIWLCHGQETGELLAYATASFDSGQNKFTDFEVHTISSGTTGDLQEQQNEFNSLVDRLSEISEDDEDVSYDAQGYDPTDNIEARQWLKDKLEGEQNGQ